MVVDDDFDDRYSVKQGLEYLYPGYKVLCVDSGKQCVNLLKDETPDIILLDVAMPEMSGWAVFDLLKTNESWKDIPMIFLTTQADNIAKGTCDSRGQDYIEKPFGIKDMKRRIDKVLIDNKESYENKQEDKTR